MQRNLPKKKTPPNPLGGSEKPRWRSPPFGVNRKNRKTETGSRNFRKEGVFGPGSRAVVGKNAETQRD